MNKKQLFKHLDKVFPDLLTEYQEYEIISMLNEYFCEKGTNICAYEISKE